ncbi:MAG TPA: HAMP domain-containing sensor histidine kinase [Streptosporangiaceae bacterium]|nr:HAMP domain-containing sensor histidine kinase [Streptosporangiaceae bacterium]
MIRGRAAARAWRGKLPRPTIRLRLTLSYGGLFLVFGMALLAVTYILVVRALADGTAGNAFCQRVRQGCHVIGARQALSLVLRNNSAELPELLIKSGIALAAMTVLAFAFGWIVADRVLRPLRAITATAREMSASSLAKRLAMNGPDDEFRELGDTFDALMARLEASFSAQRQFIANASHELRTPLTRQRVISQVALGDPAATIDSLSLAHQRILAAGAEQEKLIDAMLTLARGQAGLDKREPFDLAVVASQVIGAREPEAVRRNLTLHVALAPAPAYGSPGLVERLIANLVDNALHHNLPCGQITVTTVTHGSTAILSVANTGPPIPASAVDQLFQPFMRLAADRASRGEGLGLGLSIVQAIAEAHGAAITARPEPEGGLLVEAAFPCPLPD